MSQTIAGIFIGISTSIIAGILLIWKGDQFVGHLKNLPTKRRISLFTDAYLRALRSYPYRYLHYLAWVGVMFVILLTFWAYVSFTYAAFQVSPAHSPEALRQAWHAFLPNPLAFQVFRWIAAGITALYGIWLIPTFYRTYSIEILIPYAHREVERVRDCVAKCGTCEEFVGYINAEHKAKNLTDLKALFRQAKAIIGAGALIDEIIKSLSDGKTT
jgi:hypothetical protein